VSKDHGLEFVYLLTGLVNQFDDWLNRMKDTGQIDKFWAAWTNSVKTAFWAFQHPVDAFNKFMPKVLDAIDIWLPRIMDHIANTFASAAPTMAMTFARAFVNAGGWAKFFTIAIFLKKFGFFTWVGKGAATYFIKPFLASFGTAFVASIGGEALAGSVGAKIATASSTAGKGAGKLFGAGFLIGFLLLLPEIEKEMDKLAKRTGMTVNKPGTKENQQFGPVTGVAEKWIRDNVPGANALYKLFGEGAGSPRKKNRSQTVVPLPGTRPHGGALGGILPPGGTAIVGETGPELATMGSRGTTITPLSRNSRHTLPGALEIPNLDNVMHVSVFSTINVDRREIARAVSDQNAYRTARRGGTPVRNG
jgi:hypothetical protein